MWPDIVNGTFEALGGVFLWLNVLRLWRDKGYAGVNWQAIAFFAAWGLWNLFYYPSLAQWWSFTGGLVLVVANLVWLGLAFHFGPKGGRYEHRT